MEPQTIQATIEVFPENGKVKARTIIKPETKLNKEQKTKLKSAVNESLHTGRTIWRRNHSNFMVTQHCLLK